jgi:hypothetical protein
MAMASSWTKPEGIAVVLGTKGAFAVEPYGRGRPFTDLRVDRYYFSTIMHY